MFTWQDEVLACRLVNTSQVRTTTSETARRCIHFTAAITNFTARYEVPLPPGIMTLGGHLIAPREKEDLPHQKLSHACMHARFSLVVITIKINSNPTKEAYCNSYYPRKRHRRRDKQHVPCAACEAGSVSGEVKARRLAAILDLQGRSWKMALSLRV